ncbi:MAG: hypothetical protein MUF35_02690 [Candidatus Nanopelagicales bacterium]|jgi:hypothetical protein|nr:hypothetical protein [Candidatus Nanopelagicales bacterium]
MTQDERTGQGSEGYQPVSHDEEGNARLAGEQRHEAPNPETGVGVGMGEEPTSFEPEEDPEAAPGDVAGE